jgi:hypothetical protein
MWHYALPCAVELARKMTYVDQTKQNDYTVQETFRGPVATPKIKTAYQCGPYPTPTQRFPFLVFERRSDPIKSRSACCS